MQDGFIIACPICKSSSQYSEQNPYRPFCSKRCQIQDQAAWADEAYTVSEAGEEEN